MSGHATPAPASLRAPVDLTIPATLLTPVKSKSNDYLGTAVELAAGEHAGLFQFRGGSSHSERDGKPFDVFSAERINNGTGETVEALALAARASAGFPVAFEPTFIPVRPTASHADGRPNMALYADWFQPDSAEDLSRFAVDGGVLANTPTRPALEGIRRRQVADTMVRRVLILVHPHAEYARDIKNVADKSMHPPTLVGALAGVAGAAGSVGSRKYVEEIQQHNELALQWRDGRQAALTKLSADNLTDLLGETDRTHAAWQLFRTLRLRRGAYQSARNIRTRFATSFANLIEYAVEIMEEDDHARGSKGLAFLPKDPPNADDLAGNEWQWGLHPIWPSASRRRRVSCSRSLSTPITPDFPGTSKNWRKRDGQ